MDNYKYILLYKTGANRTALSAKHSLFESPVVITHFHGRLVISRAGIDNKGQTATRKKSGWYALTISRVLPVGRFDIDMEESNIDQIVIYFE